MNRRPHLRRSSRWQRARLFLEELEPRRVMDGAADDSLALQHFASSDELQQHLVLRAVEQYKDLFGTEVPYYYLRPMSFENVLTDAAVERNLVGQMGGDVFANAGLDLAYSNTNVQVAGVDEGDLVKTDGEFLYVARDRRLTIVDARDPTQLAIVARVTLDQPASQMYIDGDRLTVISTHFPIVPMPFIDAVSGWGPLIATDSLPGRWDPKVKVDVFDVSERATPKEVSSFELDGSLVQTRAVGSSVVLVTQDDATLPMPEAQCTDEEEPADPTARAKIAERLANGILPGDEMWPTRQCVYETQEEYVARVSDGLLERLLPHITSGGEPGGFLTDPQKIASTGVWLQQLVSTTVIDIAETPHVVDSAGIVTSYASQVYATAEHVYVTAPDWTANAENTRIVEFSLGPDLDSVAVTAVGQVAGHLLNQFSMDEHEGYLRVATTAGWGRDATNSVYVLQSQGDDLAVVGSVTGITPGETIFAARFLGDRAFLVTFERIDPLVAVDLSNPENPAVVGELEIPGFSNYLHPLAGGYLVGLGRDADPANGWGTDPLISLFNVQNLSLPTLVDRELVGIGANAWSQAFYDHHAISYFDDVGILTIPFNLPDWGIEVARPSNYDMLILENWLDSDTPGVAEIVERIGQVAPDLRRRANELLAIEQRPERPRTGLWVFQIDPTAENPIEVLGTIAHDQPVERSLRIGDALFSVSHDLVTAHDLTHPDQALGRVHIGRLVTDDSATVDVDAGPTELNVLENDRVPDDARIVAVTQPGEGGGTVSISDSGRSVIYTPPVATDPVDLHPASTEPGRVQIEPYIYRGNDWFTYSVEIADGVTETATVNIRRVREHAGRQMAELAQHDLARRLEVDPEQIQIVGVEPRVWRDGCLGAAQPDQMCTQVMTPGFVVWLSSGDRRYEYHTDSDKTVILIERVRPPQDGVIPDEFRVRQDSTANKLDVLANDFPNITFIRAPQITAVSETDQGGTVTIDEGGYSLSYTPAAGFHGTETFTYTVDSGETGKVTVLVIGREVPPDDPDPNIKSLIGIRIEVSDAEGNLVTQAELGDTLLVNVYVNDFRADAQGVFGTYLDLGFDTRLAAVSGEIVFSPDYDNGVSGTVDRSGIDELGAFSSSLPPFGPGERLLVQIPLDVTAVGELVLTSNPADLLPQHDSSLYGIDTAVSARRIEYGSTVVQVANGFHNDQDPTDSNGDGLTTPTDALPIINWINANGAGSVKRIRDAELRAEAAGEAVERNTRRFDTNGDGHCTHMDVLMVFNRVNNDFLRRAAGEGEAFPVPNETPVLNSSQFIFAGPATLSLPAQSAVQQLAADSVEGNAVPVVPLDADDSVESFESARCSEEIERLLDELVDSSDSHDVREALFAELG